MRQETDELGARVSAAGGVSKAPERAARLGAAVLQLFTKPPSQWKERPLDKAEVEAFRRMRRARDPDGRGARFLPHQLRLVGRTALPALGQGVQCRAGPLCPLGIEFLVTHPGNATDGDREGGLERVARGIEAALEEVRGCTMVLLETTAGGGAALGATFEELAVLRRRIRAPLRRRVGVCMDLCHVWGAGYDIRDDYDGVFRRFDEVLGLRHLRLFHLNDSAAPLGSLRDRHAHIGEGALGAAPFRRLMRDGRFRAVPKILETPKDGDEVASDRRNLRRLRRYRRG